MSEHFSTTIIIGGKVKRRLVPALCKAICDENVSLEWGDSPFSPGSAEDLLHACTEQEGRTVLQLYDDQASWGHFERLESFLQQHQIAFDRQSDGKYEYDPQLVQYRPRRKPVVTITSADGQPVVAASYLAPVRKLIDLAVEQFDDGSTERGVRLVRRVQRWLKSRMPPEVPPLTSLEIVGGAPSARRETGGSAGVG